MPELIPEAVRLCTFNGDTHVLLGKPEEVHVHGLGKEICFHVWQDNGVIVLRLVELTPTMIKAGVAALSENAALFLDCGGRQEVDAEIVSDIYRAMVTAEDPRSSEN